MSIKLKSFKYQNLGQSRTKKSIVYHQDTKSDSFFSTDAILPIRFFKCINYSISNINDESSDIDQFKNDLYHSFELVENYLKESNQIFFNSFLNDFISLIIDVFINIDINVDIIDPLFQFYGVIFGQLLHCMCCLISFKSSIFQKYYSDDFLDRFILILHNNLLFENNGDLFNCSQFIFSKLIEDEQFRLNLDYNYWLSIFEPITDHDILSSIYFELSKSPQKIGLKCINSFLYSILDIFPEKENFRAKIDCVKKNSQAIVNCLDKVCKDATDILEQACKDIFQYMHKFIALLDINTEYNDDDDDEDQPKTLAETQNEQIICFCNLMACFFKKGMIKQKDFETLFIDDTHIITTLMSVLEFIETLVEEENEFLSSYHFDDVFDRILFLFSHFTIFKFRIDEAICIKKCVEFALDSTFKIKVASALLICKIVDTYAILVTEDDYDECDCLKDENVYRLILDLILLDLKDDILEPLLNCVITLFKFNPGFIDFIMDCNKYEDLYDLFDLLSSICENTENKQIYAAADDIIYEIRRELPKSQEEIYDESYYENTDVYGEV